MEGVIKIFTCAFAVWITYMITVAIGLQADGTWGLIASGAFVSYFVGALIYMHLEEDKKL